MTSKFRKGDHVRARVRHSGTEPGKVGQVTAVYNGTYYAMHYPGVDGVCYSPEPHLSAAPQAAPDAPNGPDTPSDTGMAPSSASEAAADAQAATAGGWTRMLTGLVDLARR